MSFENKDGQGAFFRNDKQGNDKRPDYRGTIKLGGVEYELAGWIKQSGKGVTYMSLSGKVKVDGSKVPTGGRNDPRPPANEEFDDDIPF